MRPSMTPCRPHLSEDCQMHIKLSLTRRQILIGAASSAVAALLLRRYPEPRATGRAAVLGVGGAGGNLVHLLTPQKSSHLLIAHTDKPWALRSRDGLASIPAGELSFTKDPRYAHQRPENAEIVAKVIYDSLPQMDRLVIVAGLGGITGTFVAPALAQIARRSGVCVSALVILPFAWEGDVRHSLRARYGLDALSQTAESMKIVDMERELSGVQHDITMSEFFERQDRRAARMIEEIIDQPASPRPAQTSW